MELLFDIRTLFLVLVVISVALSIDLIFYWSRYRPQIQGPFHWAAAMIAITFGSLFFVFRGYIHPFFSIVVANTFTLGGYVLIHRGLRLFFKEDQGKSWERTVVILTVLFFTIFTIILPHLIARIFVFSLIGAVCMFRCFYLLFKRKDTVQVKPHAFATFTPLILAIVFVIRAVLTISGIGTPDSESFLSANLITIVTLLAEILTYISLTIGLVSLPGQVAMEEVEKSAMELAMLNKELTDSEARFENLSDASFEGIVLSENGAIIDHNKALEQMFGYGASELLGEPVTKFVVHDQRDEVTRKILSGYALPYEILCVKKDGSHLPVEIHGRMFSYKNRKVRVTAVRDLTEKKQAEAEIKKLQGILPICMHCKGIRDDQGYWNQIESYISEHSEVQFSHGICEKCLQKHFPEFKGKNAKPGT